MSKQFCENSLSQHPALPFIVIVLPDDPLLHENRRNPLHHCSFQWTACSLPILNRFVFETKVAAKVCKHIADKICHL